MSRKRKKPAGRRKVVPTLCNGCGGCCDPVVLAMGPELLRQILDREPRFADGMEPRQVEWILNELTPCGPPPWVPEGVTVMTVIDVGGQRLEAEAGFYRCENYDEVTRECRRYEERPEVCRDFPWAGGRPDGRAQLPPACEFLRDVGREPVPVELMRRPRR